MIRKKMLSTVSFLKVFGFVSFLTGIVLTFDSAMSKSLIGNYLQYFSSWFSLDLSLVILEDSSIFAAIFFSIAYLSSFFLYKSFPDSYKTSGDLMIKKISSEPGGGHAVKNVSENDQKFSELVFEKIDGLLIEIDAARHDLFNLMLDINGIHTADDAQKSLDSLEKSISIIKDLKKLEVNGK